nr:hypothetical protein [Tanacetum cinerariifolium]
MRIPLLYRGKYSQWHERFMNYLEEQTDGEAMINSIQNGDHPLPIVAQLSLAGTAPNAIPTLKDPNNETAKDLWDALERQMRGSEYSEQDRKATILYEYETFKATEGEQLLDTYLRCLQVINDLKKCSYKKDNCYFAKDCKKAKVKDYNYYKKKILLAKKDNDEQVLLAEDQAWMEYSSDSDLEMNANMVIMAKMEKVISDSDKSSFSAKETIVEVAYYTFESESESEYETSEYYDNSTNYGLFVNDNDDQEIFHDAIESAKASSSSADEKISEVSYYLSESESESKFETSEYYDNSTNYALFVNNDDDQENFYDAIESASENFIEIILILKQTMISLMLIIMILKNKIN